MKRIYLLEEFEFKQLQKGRTIEFGDGQAIALSPDVDVSTHDGARPVEKKVMSKDQKSRMRRSVYKTKDGSYACRQCTKGGFKNRTAGNMHFMSNHVKGWRNS